jgi:glycosyltransferase involved in cell wall biosynthesis
MDKKNIIVVINNLGLGGAEKLVVGLLPSINRVYNVILVTLSDKQEISDSLLADAYHQKYSLCFTGKLSMIRCVSQLRKIIKKHKPAIVHSHLFYSNIISRVACPANIPCLNTLHGLQSYEVYNRSIAWTFLEKRTVKKRHAVMAVSQHVLDDYKNIIKKTKKLFVLPNFVGDEFFAIKPAMKTFNGLQQLRLVAVGNVKPIKNHIYLIEAFKKLKGYNISLDVYGADQDHLLESYQKMVAEHQLPIQFKGLANNIQELLPQYDLYVMPSISEGCSVAVLEAMVLGLPLLLSDLPGLNAETMGNALFFNIASLQPFINRIKEIIGGKYDLNTMSAKGIMIAKENYTKNIYMEKLFSIYNKII